jgi:hypothetical protein
MRIHEFGPDLLLGRRDLGRAGELQPHWWFLVGAGEGEWKTGGGDVGFRTTLLWSEEGSRLRHAWA